MIDLITTDETDSNSAAANNPPKETLSSPQKAKLAAQRKSILSPTSKQSVSPTKGQASEKSADSLIVSTEESESPAGESSSSLKISSSMDMSQFANRKAEINELLIFATENGCSDLYIKLDEQPYLNQYGKLYRVPCYPTNRLIFNDWAKIAISSENNATYVRQKMLDFSYVVPAKGYRYRASAGFSTNKNTCVFRMIDNSLPTFGQKNIPKDMQALLNKSLSARGGITLLAAPTGNGKTTTIAASINLFSEPDMPLDNSNIITLEDPIEYVYESKPSFVIRQKELGKDFKTFALGVKQALREHPSHIMVGESRDAETISVLVEAARTGHSVITTFHTGSVGDTIARLRNYLISTNPEIVYDLIANMNVIICQRLMPAANNKGYQLKYQFMYFTDAIKDLLVEAIDKGKNVPFVIGKLFKNEQLLKTGVLKDF